MQLHLEQRGTLPVLLATLCTDDRNDRVTWETIDGFDVCSGPYLQHEASPDMCGYFEQLLRRLAAAALSQELHWGYTYVCVDERGKPFVTVMMLDNEPFEPGTNLVRRFRWPAISHGYSVRHFFVLVPR